MASKKHIMFDLDDEKLSVLAEVLSNKTSKKIIEHLVDSEASEAEIGRDLKLPANTVNYNIKKLAEAGLIEPSKNWFWSVKGKKVLRYRVANKNIIISPKRKSSNTSKNLLSALLITGIGALVIKFFTSSGSLREVNNYGNEVLKATRESVDSSASVGSIAPNVDYGSGVSQAIQVSGFSQIPEVWVWFLFGGIAALVIFMILNWRNFRDE